MSNSSSTGDVVHYVDETGAASYQEVERRLLSAGIDLSAPVAVAFGYRMTGKSTYNEVVARFREEQRQERLRRDIAALGALPPPAQPHVGYEREQRKQLLKNTRGPRASRWS